MQIPKMELAAIIFDGDSEIIEKYKDILLKQGIKKVKCKNCGRYFILNPRQKSEYCDNKLPNINMTCRQIATQKKYKEKQSPIQKAYINALKNENKKLHLCKNETYYDSWKKEKSVLREEFQKKYDNAETDCEKQNVLEEFKRLLKFHKEGNQ